jgi:chloramphenicol-sensitive protein RarD
MNKGTLYAIGGYIFWGLLPLYWKALQHIPPLEILSHRIVWACVVTLLLLATRGQWRQLGAALRSRRTVLMFGLSALLLASNWFIYIWAVNAGQIVETSLGYFINPLVSVLLGVIFLHERLRPAQTAAVLVALGGVLYLTALYGALPWIALLLAGTFAIYGLLRKTASLDSLVGLTLETLLIMPLALIYLLTLEAGGSGAFGHTGLASSLLLAFSGLVTAVPLLLFAAGARKITLTTLGLLQYIAPSIQLSIGVLIYGEELSPQRLIGFALIWLALALYTGEGLLRTRSAPTSAAAQASAASKP